jgi:uncharacterized protein (DUF849 family)
MSKVIVTVAPTGGMASKEQNPDLPMRPDEIAEDVERCCEAGASIAAIHARNPDGSPTCNSDIYTEINEKVRDRCDIIINNSTGGGLGGDMTSELPDGRKEQDWEERLKGARGEGVEMATFDCWTTSIAFGDETYLQDTSMERCEELGDLLQERDIKPEWEVFTPSHIMTAKQLIEMGYDEPPYYINIVLNGHQSFQDAMPYEPEILQHMVSMLPEETEFNVSAIGPAQVPATTQSVILGGHLRVGLEDNLYYEQGELATNVELVERAVRIIRELGHEPATPAEAREILGL